MSPHARSRPRRHLYRKVRFYLAHDECGVWVPVAAILLVGIVVAAMSLYASRELSRIKRQEAFERTEAINEGLVNLQQRLQKFEPGSMVNLQTALAVGAPSIYAPGAGGTLSVTDAPSSSIRALSFTGRWGLEEGLRSDNGLSENITVWSNPNSDNGVITLDNNWWGNRFITDTHRSQGYKVTSYKYKFSMRFVPQANGTIDNARAFIYVYARDYPRLRLTYTDGTVQELYAVADARVDNKAPDANYGDDYDIRAGASTKIRYRTFLKFDLSRIPAGKSIDNAQIALACSSLYDSPTIDAHSVTDDSWVEDTITWNNMPGYTAGALSSTTVTATYATYYWTVTSFVQNQFAGDNVASFLLKHTTESVTESETAYFSSREYLAAKLSIMTDAGGIPGTLVGNEVVVRFPDDKYGGIWSDQQNFGWIVGENLNASVARDNVYHLVVTPFAAHNLPNEYAYYTVAYSSPRNTVWVDNGVTNENRGLLLYGRENPDVNERWVEFPDYEPVYVLRYTNGTYQGNPYHPGFKLYSEKYYYSDIGKYGEDDIFVSFLYSSYQYSAGKVYSSGWSADDQVWGENFYIPSPMTVTAFEVPIARKGAPTYDLEVRIENSTWGETFILKPHEVRASQTPAWHRLALSQPRTLSGRYWIYLRTRGYTKYDYYVVPLDNASGLPTNLSWDGANSYAFRADMPNESTSFTNLQSFTSVDMPFRLIREDYRSPGAYTSKVISPGNRVKWLNVSWDNITPAGTSARVEVRVGDMARPEDPNVYDDPNFPWQDWKEVTNGQDLKDVFGSDENRATNCLQFRVILSTTNPALTPNVWNVYVRYYDGTGTTREPPALTWVQTTNGDFRQGLDEINTENVSVGGGAVKLRSSTGEGWTTLTGPPKGVGDKNGHRFAEMGGYIYFWVAYGGDPGTAAGSTDGVRFYRYDPATGTWASDWNASFVENAPFSSPYGLSTINAKDPSGNPAVYIIRGYWSGTTTQFARWTEQAGWVTTINTTIPWGGTAAQLYPRNGSEFVWNGGDYLYYFPGSGYSYNQYDWYRYSISGDSWTYMGEIPSDVGKNGPGNAGVFVNFEGENYIYIHFGHTPSSDYTPAKFARYRLSTGTWQSLTKHQYGADDGASLVWDGGDYLYHTPGAYKEGLPVDEERRFLKYSISNDTWEELEMVPYNATGGVDDGGSMVMIGSYIYKLKGGSDVPNGGGGTSANEFYRYALPNYYSSGRYISELFDAGEDVNWEHITFDNRTPTGTTLTLYVRFDTGTDLAGWTQVSSDNVLSGWGRYIRYRADFTTTSVIITPSVNSVRVRYTLGEAIQTYNWTQTDWSGDSGQLVWSDATSYYDNENVSGTLSVGDIVLVPGAENRLWGDNFLVDQVLASDTLDQNAERLSLRFRARRNENVYGVRVYVNSYSDAGLAAKIFRDNSSNPGKPGDNITVENTADITGTGWLYIGFSAPAVLVKDNIYHIVVRMEPVTEETKWWTQTDWQGGPVSPLQVDNFPDTYDNFYENENVNWTLVPGKIRAENVTGTGPGPTQNIQIQNFEPDNAGQIPYSLSGGGPGTFERVNDASRAYSGSYLVLGDDVDAAATIQFNSVDVSAYDNVWVHVWNKWEGDLEASEYYRGYVSVDGGGYVKFFEMEGQTGADPQDWRYTWHENTYDAGDTASTVQVRIIFNETNQAGTAADKYLLDDVLITGNGTVTTTQYENGWFTSSVYDAGDNDTRWNYVDWAENKPTGTDLAVYARFDNTDPTGWSTGKPADGSGTPAWGAMTNPQEFSTYARYAQYAAEFTATDDTYTAELENIRLRFGLPLGGGSSGTQSQTTWTGGPGENTGTWASKFNTSENIDWGDSLQLQVSGSTPTDNYGNLFRVDSAQIIGRLDNDNYLADIRFTSQATKYITGVRFYLSQASNPPVRLRVRLANNNAADNTPNLATGTLRDNDNVQVTTSGAQWASATFSSYQLSASTIYHIAINRMPGAAGAGENRAVQEEPATLENGDPRIGVLLGGTDYTPEAQVEDGIYENIRENNVGVKASEIDTEAYTKVEVGTVYGGTTPDNLDADDSNYYEVDAASSGGGAGWYYAENTTKATKNSSEWSTHVTLTFTPSATENYLFIANSFLSMSNSTEHGFVKFLIDGTEYALENTRAEGAGGASRYTFETHKRIQLSGGAEHTAEIQYRDGGVDTGTVSIENSVIIAMRVTSASPTAENEAEVQTTSTTYVDRATLSFTSDADNYLVLGTAEITNNSATYSSYVQLTQGTTSQGEMLMEPQDVGHWYTYTGVRLFTLSAEAQDFRVQYKTESATAGREAKIRQARVTAAKLSDIGSGSWTAESEEASTTTLTTYQDKTTLTFTAPATDNYLVLAFALLNSNQNAANDIVYAQLLVGSTPYGEELYRPNDVTDYTPFFVARKLELTDGSQTLKIQYKAGSGGLTAAIKNARIIVIRQPSASLTYSLDIRHDSGQVTTNQANVDNVYVKLNFKSTASVTYTWQIYDFTNSTWLTLNSGSVGTTEVTWENTITTNPDNYISDTAGQENIRVRLYTSNEASAHRSQEDFLQYKVNYRVDNYRLRWEHKVTGIGTYDNYRVRIKGYRTSGEVVSIKVWNGSTFYDNGYDLPTALGWVEYGIPSSWVISGAVSILYEDDTAGDSAPDNIYIDYAGVEGISAAPVLGWVEVACSLPNNKMRPLDNSSDPAAGTLFYRTSWTSADNQPVYLLENSASPEGNPFAGATSYGIYSTYRAGENFTVSGGDRTIVRVRAYVRTSGTPADSLYFAIRSSANADIVTGTLAAPTSYLNYTWLEANIASTTLTNGATYHFILYSPDSTSSAYWILCAPSTGASDSIYVDTTYNGNGSVATSSSDGGSSWTRDNQRDVVYSLMPGTATYRPSGYLLSSWYDSANTTTSWGTITFTDSKPTGTADNVWVQVKNDNTGEWSASGGPYTSGANIGLAGQYIRYRVRLDANPSQTSTPTFSDISIGWSIAGEGAGAVTLRVSSPLNAFMSYDNSPDNANVLYSADGSSWTLKDNQPIYVLDVDTNANGVVDAHEGNPYDTAGYYAIYGDHYAGVRFKVSGEVSGKTKVTRGVYVYVRKVGSPPNPLNYTLYSISDGATLASGQAATAAQVGTGWTWIYIPIEKALVEGKEYRFYLSTSAGDAGNCYQWMAPGRTITYLSGRDDRATFDGTNTYGSTSATAGAGWTDNTRRDVIFRFKVADNFTTSGWLESSVYDAGETVDWTSTSVSSSLSAGTSVTLRVRAGDDSNPYDGGWSGWTTDITSLANSRYIQYRLELSTSTNTTPVVHSVTISYQETGAGGHAPQSPEPTIRTWVQTTRSDFLAGRTSLGGNVEVVSPGDVVLKAEGYWGNEFVSDSGFAPASRLDNRTKLFSVRFVAENTENLMRVRLLTQVVNEGKVVSPGDSPGEADNTEWWWLADNGEWQHVTNNEWWRVRICTSNADGTPNLSNVLGENTGHPDKEWSWEWYMPYPRLGRKVKGDHVGIPIYPAVQLTAGQTYHIVVDANPATASYPAHASYISRDNYITIVATKPRHPDNKWINDKTFNTGRAVLFSQDNGATWEKSWVQGSLVYDREPVYVLDVDRSGNGVIDSWEGNPFYKSADEIYLNSYVGEQVVIKKAYGAFAGDNISAGAVEFFTQQVGTPGEFYVGVRAGQDSLGETVYAPPLDAPSGFNWGWSRFTFPVQYRLWENETYKVYVRSPSSDTSNYLSVNTMKTSWADKEGWTATTYGGRDSVYIWSSDGVSWYTKDYREVPFRFVTRYRGPDNFISGVFDAGQVVDWQFLEWDATRPPGTGIKFWVRVGDGPTPGGATWTGWQGPYTERADISGLPNRRYAQYMVELTPTADRRSAPAVHEVRITYRGGFGSVRIALQNNVAAGQTMIYEGGAIIVAQNNRSVMYSAPLDMIVPTKVSDNLLKVEVNYCMLSSIGSTKSVALTSMTGAQFSTPESIRVTRSGTADNFTVVVVSDFAEAWYGYLSQVSQNMNNLYGKSVSSVTPDYLDPDKSGQVTLTIQGPVSTSGVKDVEFIERAQQINVQIT